VDFQRSMNFFLPDFVRAAAVPTSPRVADNSSTRLIAGFVQSRVPQTLFAFLAIMSLVDHVDVISVGNDVRISSVDITFGWNIEQSSDLSSTMPF